jgi:hypothetical protein
MPINPPELPSGREQPLKEIAYMVGSILTGCRRQSPGLNLTQLVLMSKLG